jgi:hypothetical protein
MRIAARRIEERSFGPHALSSNRDGRDATSR